jgi:bifunctional non-homologous end joining protein LigD
MALEDYHRKRRFDATPEPAGTTARGRGSRPIFVVQLHHASRRHYDFRLQVGDTLKSWAVPKGPSFDPAVKRMAVEVEDHPLDYAGFEGQIPKGQYGGGHVALFDRGTWTTEGNVEAQLAKGHLRFELHGDRLKGGWHLVRSGKPARQPQWLLFKQDDAWAGPQEADDLLDGVTPPPAADARRAGPAKPAAKKTPASAARAKAPAKRSAAKAKTVAASADWAAQAADLPGARRRALPAKPPEPQLAKLVDRAPAGEDWLHELKWDGYRLLATVRDGAVRLWSRNGLDWTERVPEVRDALAALGLRSALLDGELVAGQGTRADFNLLQQVLSGERQGQLRYMLFDLLHLDGVDLTAAPLVERKQLLERLLQHAPAHLGYSSHGIGHADAAYKAAVEAGFEGVVSKRVDAPYRAGRGDAWRKAKAQGSDEYAVIGYTPPKGSRSGIGSLLLATPDARHGWRYAGRVGSGFSDEQLRALGKQLAGRGGDTPSVHVPDNDTDLRQARWLREPAFVVEVFTRGHGGRGLLRQASFKALRPDKTPDALRDSDRAPLGGDDPMPGTPAKKTARKTAAPKPATSAAKKPAKKSAKKATKKPAVKRPAREAPPLTHPEKVLFPEDGLRKQDVADYYAAVMDWLLPEIAGRPLSLVRCPGGIGGQCFFQKHATPGLALVSQVPIVESDGGSEDYLVVEDAAAVMELVQFNTREFHPWGARAADVEHCDRLVFDLDPDTTVAWEVVVDAARQLRGYLRQAGLESFVRTSGGKGLHLVVPLAPAVPWERARAFAQAVAEAAREADPLRYVATASKARRKDRIFIDWLRNGRGATSVASFSLRSRPGAPVCMPLRWEELGKVASGHAWTLRNAPARLKRLKSHPWAGIDRLRQTLPG